MITMNMGNLLIGTSNLGKVREISEALDGLGLSFLSLKDIPDLGKQPEEHGRTYADNALIKARFYSASGHPTLADDSGIHIDALEGELGVQTRRWGAGPDASDEEWITFFLDRMKSEKNKNARFVCALAYIDAKGHEYLFEGECRGMITEELEADYLPGLPISACFKPEGFDKVFSALTLEDKNRVSHRGRAVNAFREYLVSSRT